MSFSLISPYFFCTNDRCSGGTSRAAAICSRSDSLPCSSSAAA